MKHIHKVTIVSASIVIFLSFKVSSQDAHYWTEQFGNKSMLLGGTANACVEDLGLVFYNPGRLAQIENPAFVISAKIYELTNIQIKDGLGEGNDLKKSNFGGAPNLVAGTFKVPFLKEQHFAYSFLTRYRYKNDFDVMAIDSLINRYSNLTAKLKSNNSYLEEWYGLTWAKKLSSKYSIGISTFGINTQSSASISTNLQGLKNDSTVSMVYFNRELSFKTYGLLWKIGMAAEFEKVNLGLTVTTPRIHFGGKGNFGYEDYIAGIDSVENKAFEGIYIENHQQDQDVNYKSPLSVCLGIGIKLPNSVIHINSEWFDQTKSYTVLKANEFIGQQPKDTINFSLVEDLRSVFNFGVGYEHAFSEKINMYLSIATDFSAIDNAEDSNLYEFEKETINNSSFDSDIIHFGGGISMNLKWAELTLGTRYGGTERTIRRPLNIGDGKFFNSTATSSLKYSRWSFIVGFSFPFAEKVGGKLGFD